MRKKETVRTMLIGIVLLIMLAGNAKALGIAPARKTIEFEPNKTINLTYRVYNSDGAAEKVKAEAGGALKGIAEVRPEVIEFEDGALVKILKVKIRFGKTPPEEKTGTITLSNQNSGGTVNAGLKISATINIKSATNKITGAATTQTEEKRDENKKAREAENKNESGSKWKTAVLLAGLLALLGANAAMLARRNSREEAPEEKKPEAQKTESDETIEEIEREIERLKQL